MRWDEDDAGGVPEQLRRRVDPNRVRVGVGAAVVLVLLALGAAVLVAGLNTAGSSRTVAAPVVTGSSSTPVVAPSAGTLYVHVLGAVATAGLFVLHPGDRVVDAIAAAGGFTAEADRGGVNLARPLTDGEQIVVPRVGEVPVAAAPAGGAPAASGVGAVSLNGATAAELEELPRIGPAMAQRIVEYREQNGPFTSIDQLLEVSGIGEKTLEAFRDQVTL
ncbi:helix-hairpin-helix domain-containing protein [Microbacteriaceae bacterium VKM Ac-2854]|nr:helix-hairpin-helix domain-containing protein [Microbacteriaceae bacterium VKM Ac-2854]